ncbi:MAG: esterase [Pseudomonadales bacterium]|nr:esterase [Pseudomonadales bacterium]RLU03799.1 MAG: alpha/beta fold hydrolase [Ketobacter sp.]
MSIRTIETSLMVPLPGGQQLHLRRLTDNPDAPAVLLLHGLLEDGTIFYSRDGRGLAHYLAARGFDTYIPDLRGKGRSWPPVSGWATYRVGDAVNQDIPAILNTIQSVKGSAPVFWITHAWGGVLASSYLARYPEARSSLNGLINFGSHRVAVNRSLARYIWLDGLWGWLARLVAKFKGFIPGRGLKIGSENEFLGIQQDSSNWFRGEDWIDPVDQFDYGEALSKGLSFPPALYFAPSADLARCSAADVKGFMREIGHHNGRLVVLGQNLGNRHNYSQISMLTHPDAVHDHFPFMVNWMLEMNKLREEARSGDDPEPKSQGHSTASGK